MLSKLEDLKKRYQELENKLADISLLQDKNQYQKLAKEFSGLEDVVGKYRRLEAFYKELDELKSLSAQGHREEGLAALAREEIPGLKDKISRLEKDLSAALKAEDKDADVDVIVEIRAGTGGNEASLFAADLFRMYKKYAANRGWEAEVISSHSTELEGFKEVIFSVRGPGAYKRLKYESGVHRVQRVPVTESQGRVHTSTATVAVMKEAKDVDLVIDPKDIKIDVYRSSGPGGQSVNTTDSAVRITHAPSGLVVTCQDERSQLKNKAKALRVLRTRLLDKTQQEEFAKMTQERRSQIGTGDRSEKIRTYNFPDRRVTDHRAGITIYQLENVMQGQIDPFLDALISQKEEKNNQ